MGDSWEERRRAQEEQYFDKQNQAALERLKARSNQPIRRSPVSGEPMEQLTIMGVVVDRDPKSGGIWLDAGELEQIITAATHTETKDAWTKKFFDQLFAKKN